MSEPEDFDDRPSLPDPGLDPPGLPPPPRGCEDEQDELDPLPSDGSLADGDLDTLCSRLANVDLSSENIA